MSARTCEGCGYVLGHPKHYRNCVDKPSWPAEMRDKTYRQAMPQVEVAISAASGITRVPVLTEVRERETVTAEFTIPHVEAGQPLPPLPKIPQVGGACCAHPEQVHVADAEGFPPTCMSCPEDAAHTDEHAWVPLMTTDQVIDGDYRHMQREYFEFQVEANPLACPVCGRVSASLTGARSHQRAHARRNEN